MNEMSQQPHSPPPQPVQQSVPPPPSARERSARWMRRWGWPLTIFFGFLSLGALALLVWPLPTLADCTLVSGRVSEVQYGTVGSGDDSHERLRFKLEGNERYYSYEEIDPLYEQVKSRLRIRVNARVWFKEPPTFLFPLYSKELWRIEVGEQTVVDYDTIAADARWEKAAIGLTGFLFSGFLTFILLLATIRSTRTEPPPPATGLPQPPSPPPPNTLNPL